MPESEFEISHYHHTKKSSLPDQDKRIEDIMQRSLDKIEGKLNLQDQITEKASPSPRQRVQSMQIKREKLKEYIPMSQKIIMLHKRTSME